MLNNDESYIISNFIGRLKSSLALSCDSISYKHDLCDSEIDIELYDEYIGNGRYKKVKQCALDALMILRENNLEYNDIKYINGISIIDFNIYKTLYPIVCSCLDCLTSQIYIFLKNYDHNKDDSDVSTLTFEGLFLIIKIGLECINPLAYTYDDRILSKLIGLLGIIKNFKHLVKANLICISVYLCRFYTLCTNINHVDKDLLLVQHKILFESLLSNHYINLEADTLLFLKRVIHCLLKRLNNSVSVGIDEINEDNISLTTKLVDCWYTILIKYLIELRKNVLNGTEKPVKLCKLCRLVNEVPQLPPAHRLRLIIQIAFTLKRCKNVEFQIEALNTLTTMLDFSPSYTSNILYSNLHPLLIALLELLINKKLCNNFNEPDDIHCERQVALVYCLAQIVRTIKIFKHEPDNEMKDNFLHNQINMLLKSGYNHDINSYVGPASKIYGYEGSSSKIISVEDSSYTSIRRGSSSTLPSINGIATPGDRGEGSYEEHDLPVADLREAEGELNKGIICNGKEAGTSVGSDGYVHFGGQRFTYSTRSSGKNYYKTFPTLRYFMNNRQICEVITKLINLFNDFLKYNNDRLDEAIALVLCWMLKELEYEFCLKLIMPICIEFLKTKRDRIIGNICGNNVYRRDTCDIISSLLYRWVLGGKILNTCIELVDEDNMNNVINIINELFVLALNIIIECSGNINKELEDCIGLYIKKFGIDFYLSKLPFTKLYEIPITSDNYNTESYKFMLPILKRQLRYTDLNYFPRYILPVIEKLEQLLNNTKELINNINDMKLLNICKEYEFLIDNLNSLLISLSVGINNPLDALLSNNFKLINHLLKLINDGGDSLVYSCKCIAQLDNLNELGIKLINVLIKKFIFIEFNENNNLDSIIVQNEFLLYAISNCARFCNNNVLINNLKSFELALKNSNRSNISLVKISRALLPSVNNLFKSYLHLNWIEMLKTNKNKSLYLALKCSCEVLDQQLKIGHETIYIKNTCTLSNLQSLANVLGISNDNKAHDEFNKHRLSAIAAFVKLLCTIKNTTIKSRDVSEPNTTESLLQEEIPAFDSSSVIHPTTADASSNLLSLKGKVTPVDRGRSEGDDVTSSGLPAADLWEAEGDVTKEVPCHGSSVERSSISFSGNQEYSTEKTFVTPGATNTVNSSTSTFTPITLPVQTNLNPADSSSNYFPVNGKATPGDRSGEKGSDEDSRKDGSGDGRNVISSGIPGNDLRELEGQENKEAVCKTKQVASIEGIVSSMDIDENLVVGYRLWSDELGVWLSSVCSVLVFESISNCTVSNINIRSSSLSIYDSLCLLNLNDLGTILKLTISGLTCGTNNPMLQIGVIKCLTRLISNHCPLVEGLDLMNVLKFLLKRLKDENIKLYIHLLKFIRVCIVKFNGFNLDWFAPLALKLFDNNKCCTRARIFVRRVIEKLISRLKRDLLFTIFPKEHIPLLKSILAAKRRKKNIKLRTALYPKSVEDEQDDDKYVDKIFKTDDAGRLLLNFQDEIIQDEEDEILIEEAKRKKIKKKKSHVQQYTYIKLGKHEKNKRNNLKVLKSIVKNKKN